MHENNVDKDTINKSKFFIDLHPEIFDLILDNYKLGYTKILNLISDKIKELKKRNIDPKNPLYLPNPQ